MSTTSTPEDVLRFVRLRLPNGAAARLIQLQLTSDTGPSTTLGFKLANAPRADRRERAVNWLYTEGGDIIAALPNNDLYTQVLETVRTVLRENESPTVRILFIHLADSDLSAEIDSEARDALAEQLSDVLLASFFAPQHGPPNLNDLDHVLRTLLLLEVAEQEGLTPEDLRSRRRSSDFLDLELRELFAWPMSLPGPESLWNDYEDKFSVGVADLLVVKQHIKEYGPGEIAHIENVMASETRERTHRRLDRSEEIFTIERETEVEKETELETTERFEISEEVSRTVKEDQQLKFGLGLSGKYGPTVEFSSNFEFQRRESREETSNISTSYAKDIVERSLERVRERVKRKRTTRILQEIEETNLHSFKNESGKHIVGIYQFVEKVYRAQVFNYGKREMFDLAVPEPASYLWHRRNSGGERDEEKEPDAPDPLNKGVIPYLDATVKEAKNAGILRDNIVVGDGEKVKLYEFLAAQYRSGELEAPPDEFQTVATTKQFPSQGAKEGDTRSTMTLKLGIPKDYKPKSARISAVAFDHNKHEDLFILFTIIDKMSTRDPNYKDDTFTFPDFAAKHDSKLISTSQIGGISSDNDIMLLGNTISDEINNEVILDAHAIPQKSDLNIGVFAYQTKRYIVTVRMDCKRTEAAMQAWRLKTFNTLNSAYENRLLEYQEAMARHKQEKRQREEEENTEREFGTSPSRKEEIIRGELKKHCIAIVTENFYSEEADTTHGTTKPAVDLADGPPRFDFEVARKRGAFARFFEQAFEWEHLQYVFYPYYWARKEETWDDRFDEDDPAHRFRQFMQAGWARVVVPVRPGFEEALHYYLLTGEVWKGRELPPRIGDDLSLSIADEIRNRTDQGVLQAIPHEDPWDVRVPTSLVYLAGVTPLPKWERVKPDSEDDPKNYWNWRPVEPDEESD